MIENFKEIELPSVALITEQLIFKTIWDRMPKKSFVSGLWLRCFWNTPLWVNCFTRVLPPEQYPYMKYFFGNVIMTTPGEHSLYVNGTEEARIDYALDFEEKSRGKDTADWQAVKELAEDLKRQYAKSFPTTHGMIVNYSYSIAEQERIIGKMNKKFWDGFK